MVARVAIRVSPANLKAKNQKSCICRSSRLESTQKAGWVYTVSIVTWGECEFFNFFLEVVNLSIRQMMPTSLNTTTQLYAHNSLVSILSFGLLQRKIHETIDNVARKLLEDVYHLRSYLGTHWCKFDHKMIKPISQLQNSQQFAKSHGAVLCCTPWASGPVVWHPTCCRHLWRTKCQATRPSWRFGSWIFMTSWVEFDSFKFPRQHFCLEPV